MIKEQQHVNIHNKNFNMNDFIDILYDIFDDNKSQVIETIKGSLNINNHFFNNFTFKNNDLLTYIPEPLINEINSNVLKDFFYSFVCDHHTMKRLSQVANEYELHPEKCFLANYKSKNDEIFIRILVIEQSSSDLAKLSYNVFIDDKRKTNHTKLPFYTFISVIVDKKLKNTYTETYYKKDKLIYKSIKEQFVMGRSNKNFKNINLTEEIYELQDDKTIGYTDKGFSKVNDGLIHFVCVDFESHSLKKVNNTHVKNIDFDEFYQFKDAKETYLYLIMSLT